MLGDGSDPARSRKLASGPASRQEPSRGGNYFPSPARARNEFSLGWLPARANFRSGSIATEMGGRRRVRLTPDSDRTADIPDWQLRASSRSSHGERNEAQLISRRNSDFANKPFRAPVKARFAT